MDQVWSWILTLPALVGLWAAGSGKRWGWAVAVATQFAWVVYAILTEQYGFILSAIVYSVVFGRNWIKHPKENKDER